MLIVMHHQATTDDIEKVKEAVNALGYKAVELPGAERTAVGVVGNEGWVDDESLKGLKGVLHVTHITKPYKLVSRDFQSKDTVINLGRGVKIGGSKTPLLMIAGPCAVESEEQLIKTAKFLKKIGVQALRGGAYKPRTSPHTFQGMREKGIEIFARVRKATGILTVTEVMSPEHVGFIAENVDILQIGARNMQNFDLLKEVGKVKNPIILKRGLSATVEEWVAAAEYIMYAGNPKIIMCERGIRTFETATRNTADLAVISLVKKMCHLPIIFDPSHATGKRDLVAPMALASVVAGAHGIMVEVHPEPEKACSDGQQTLNFEDFKRLNNDIQKLAAYCKSAKIGR